MAVSDRLPSVATLALAEQAQRAGTRGRGSHLSGRGSLFLDVVVLNFTICDGWNRACLLRSW